MCRRTVHTALGEPGSSDTAISATSRPCLKALNEDLGPLPQARYTWGVSSPVKSATWQATTIKFAFYALEQFIYTISMLQKLISDLVN